MGRNGMTSVNPVNPMKTAATSVARLRRHRTSARASASGPDVGTCPMTSEADGGVVGVGDVDRVDEADLSRRGLHHERRGARPVAEESDTLHQGALGDSGRSEDEVTTRREIGGGI